MKQYDIGIIIINYNKSDLTIACVRSIIERTDSKINYQLVIVDNASTFEDFSNLKESFDAPGFGHVKLVRSMINTGFGGGNMFGVQHVDASYYAFINNDTLLVNDCLSILKNYMDKQPEIAVCGPEIFNEEQERQVSFDHFSSLLREVLGKRFLEIIHPKKSPNRKKKYEKPLLVNYVNGSFMFCRANDFHNVGGFDTNIFLFYEESDLSYRLLKQGKSTCFIPEAKYMHYQGKSLPDNIISKIELKTSMFYVIRKNHGYIQYQLLRIILLVKYAFTCLVKPKYLPLLYRILIGMPVSKSIKQQQKIVKF